MQLQIEKENLEQQIKGNQGSSRHYESEINRLILENHRLQNELDERKVR